MAGRANRSRERKFTAAMRTGILKWLRAGNFRESACRRMQVSDRCFRLWMQRGNEEIRALDEAEEKIARGDAIVDVPALSEYGRFALEVEKVETEAEQKCVGIILASEDTKDHQWFLERRYPKRWGKGATRVEVSGPDGGAVKVEDARRVLADKLLAQLARQDAQAPAEADDPQPAD